MGLKRALIHSLRDLVLITSLSENEPGFCRLFFSSPPSPPPYRFATITHTDVPNRKLKLHLRVHTLSYCSNVIVWTETVSALLDPIHASPVRACSESVRVFVHMPGVHPVAEQITPIPSYKGQGGRGERPLRAHNGPNQHEAARARGRQRWQRRPCSYI